MVAPKPPELFPLPRGTLHDRLLEGQGCPLVRRVVPRPAKSEEGPADAVEVSAGLDGDVAAHHGRVVVLPVGKEQDQMAAVPLP